jgi:hypothetical protein
MSNVSIVLCDGTIMGHVYGIAETVESRQAALDVVRQVFAALGLDDPAMCRAYIAMRELATGEHI